MAPSPPTPPPSRLRRAIDAGRGVLASIDREILVGTAMLLAVFWLVEPILDAVSALPRHVYDDAFIANGAAFASWGFGLGWLLTVVVFARSPGGTWWRLPAPARRFWLPAIAAVTALSWHLITLDENWALGQAFVGDRILLGVVALAAVCHPAFLAAFVVVAQAFTGQLNVPGMYFSWTDTNILYQTLVALFLWLALRHLPMPRRWRVAALIRDGHLRIPAASAWALMLGLLGAWYFLPATGKIRLRWLWQTDLSYIFRGAFQQHGWQRWLGAERHETIAGWLQSGALVMQGIALFTEIVVLLFLVSRRATVGILVLCLGVHTMVFLTTGILFWKWAMLLVAYIAVFLAIRPADWRRQFPRWTMVAATAGVILIYSAFGPRVKILAWYDSPFVYRFRMEVTGESGQRYEAIPATLAPFDSRFAQSRFYFLTETRRVSDCFGSVNNHLAYWALCAARTPGDVERAIATHGVVKTSASERAKLTELLERFLVWTHEQRDRPGWDAGAVKAPLHIWTRQRHDATLPRYTFQEPLQRLDMTLVQRHDFDGSYQVVSVEPVLAVTAPSPNSPASGTP